MAKPRFQGEFTELVQAEGYTSIRLTVKCDGEEYSEQHSVSSDTGITAHALREFHSHRKSQGFTKCEVVFDKKVVPSTAPPPPDIPDLELDLDW